LVFIENLKEIAKNHDFNDAPADKISGGAKSKKSIKNEFAGQPDQSPTNQ
jgi:hypothetical protein